MSTVNHRYTAVSGHSIFYREAGRTDASTGVLLHGFPTSPFMFRHLIPELADRYRVIALDRLGVGLSDARSVDEFDYSFDALAGITQALLGPLHVTRYATYVHDYGLLSGGGWPLTDPEAISAIITQNGNAYEAGFAQAFWRPVREYWHDQNPQTEGAVRHDEI